MIEIVDMAKAHAKQVAEIEKNTFAEPWSEAQIEEICGKFGVVARVAIDCDGSVAGYYSYNSVCGDGYINNVAVREDLRGKGIGKALMRDMIYTASLYGLQGLTLEVRSSNARARELYESFGFEVGGIRKKFYQNTEDAIIYWLNVGGNDNFKRQ